MVIVNKKKRILLHYNIHKSQLQPRRKPEKIRSRMCRVMFFFKIFITHHILRLTKIGQNRAKWGKLSHGCPMARNSQGAPKTGKWKKNMLKKLPKIHKMRRS